MEAYLIFVYYSFFLNNSCAPSGLPMPTKQINRTVRHHIKQYERMILMRSNSAEGNKLKRNIIIFHILYGNK